MERPLVNERLVVEQHAKHRDFSEGTPQSMEILGTICRTHNHSQLDSGLGVDMGGLGSQYFFGAPWNFLLKT